MVEKQATGRNENTSKGDFEWSTQEEIRKREMDKIRGGRGVL